MKQKSIIVLVLLVAAAAALGYIGYYGIGANTLTTVTSTSQTLLDGGGVSISYSTGYANPSDKDMDFAVGEIQKHISDMKYENVTVEKNDDKTIKVTIPDISNAAQMETVFLQIVNQALGENNDLAFEASESHVSADGTLTAAFKSGKEKVTEKELDDACKKVSEMLTEQGATNIKVEKAGNDSIQIKLDEYMNAETAVMAAELDKFDIGAKNMLGISNIKQGLDLSGGVYIVYEAKKEGGDPTAEEMNSAISMIQQRLDRKGWSETEVSKEGEKRIRVEIPGVDDAATAVEEIGQTAKLYFTDADGNPLVDGADVVNAAPSTHQETSGGPTQTVVSLEFNDKGRQDFADATSNNIGKVINIVLDGRIISAPTVNTAITDGRAIITGNFTKETADELAALIRAGSLPFDLEPLEMNSVGARLGDNSLKTSIYGGIVGVALVLLFMLLYYRLAGFAADWALVIYLCLDLVVLSLFEVTLTLPGIAGLILSVGMAVDANVIIFERIKEELNSGKTMRLSVNNGFSKALSAILDGNITTLIACVILYWFGTGPIRGFAQTLMIGIILSMFTALVITRLIVQGFANCGFTNPVLYGAKKQNKEKEEKVEEFNKSGIDIIKYKNVYFAVSLIIIAVGLCYMGYNAANGKGIFNYDTQFTGGTAIEANIGKKFENSDIEALVKENTEEKSPQVQKVGDNGESVAIKTKSLSEDERNKLVDVICEKYSLSKDVVSVSNVSGTISGEMKSNAMISVLISCIAMLIYISIRFRDLKTGGSAVLALIHDALIVLVSYGILRIAVNTSFIAAILTILGYSINATIVIFDRIRENRKRFGRNENDKLINKSVNQTMTRSIFTSLTTLFTVIALYIFGVASVKEFVLPIIIGIICGTYSSVFLSGSIWYMLAGIKKAKRK